MKASLIATVLNEEKTIEQFLDSIEAQTLKPNEVIVVDGGSTDQTVKKLIRPRLNLKVLVKKGANRAEGRNQAIKLSKNEIIAITDAGCTLDKNWLKEITEPFKNEAIQVVAGYYRAKSRTIFEKCVAPYALVMPDRVNPKTFLPASRSMAIRRDIFWKVGGFPKKFSDNEDFVFANYLKEKRLKVVFQKRAIVNWFPRSNLRGFYRMIFRFARGDAQVGLRRLKAASVFGRYFLLITLGFFKPFFGLFFFGLYLLWAIEKSWRYVRDSQAFFWLPVLQLTADAAVIAGTVGGIYRVLIDWQAGLSHNRAK